MATAGLAIGLSYEHTWASGTLSLVGCRHDRAHPRPGREIARSLPTRNLMIVNAHGGNRGMLEALGRELRAEFGLNVCTLHIGALMSPVNGSTPCRKFTPAMTRPR